MGTNHVRSLIVKAFDPCSTSGMPSPGELLSELGRESNEDCSQLAACLAGRAWMAVDPDALEDEAHHLPTLTPQAFAYYIPAFMLAGLQDAQSEAATYAMYALCPTGSFDRYRNETCSLFTPRQAEAIAEFLLFLEAEPSFVFLRHEFAEPIELWRNVAGMQLLAA